MVHFRPRLLAYLSESTTVNSINASCSRPEDFGHYHATFYRQVEALSVTPYARRSLDRGTADPVPRVDATPAEQH